MPKCNRCENETELFHLVIASPSNAYILRRSNKLYAKCLDSAIETEARNLWVKFLKDKK